MGAGGLQPSAGCRPLVNGSGCEGPAPPSLKLKGVQMRFKFAHFLSCKVLKNTSMLFDRLLGQAFAMARIRALVRLSVP